MENARLYSAPEEPPPVLVSAFGIQQMGKDQAGFMEFYRRELAPRLGL